MLMNCGVGEDLRVPCTARRSNQSILKGISPEYSLEGLMLKLKLPILWPPDAKNWLIWKDPEKKIKEKTLMLGKIEGRRRKGQQRMRWLDGITDSSLSKFPRVGDGQGGLASCSPWSCKESDTTELLNWTELGHKSSINTVSVIPVAWNLFILSLCPSTGSNFI